ncbi:MAG: hypothetical protein A2X11_09565 [Bacteroidetes bacterium GWE2_42_24]|nr:MAG: hypothetical protein A2X11_09565 [Bacteroidetes bacterium GWE2_42_24]OFY25746.1 MAG: hypothetical protein A2X09_09190 [Bacteroidetes bacterium GWF2_43_11]
MHKKENRPENREMNGLVLPRVPEMAITTGLIKAVILVFTCVLFSCTNLFAQKVKANDTIHWYDNQMDGDKNHDKSRTKDAVWNRFSLSEEVQKVISRVIPKLKVYTRYAQIRPLTKNYVFKIDDLVFKEFQEEFLLTLLNESYQRGNISIEDIVLTEFYIKHIRDLLQNVYVLDNVSIELRNPFKIHDNYFNIEVSYKLLFVDFRERVFQYGKEYYYVLNGIFVHKYIINTSGSSQSKIKPTEIYLKFKIIPAKNDSGNFKDSSKTSSGIIVSVVDVQNNENYKEYLNYHYFIVSNNESSTGIQCKFLVQELLIIPNNVYRLKVISDGLFYSRRTIFESNLTYSAAQDGFISQVFLPEDNQYDGFFSVEVFNGDGTPVADFPVTTIVLESIKTDMFPNSSPQQFIELHYVKSFFNAATSPAIPDCEDYCTMVIDQLKEAWVTQLQSGVDNFGFGTNLIDNQPLNSSEIYHVSINANHITYPLSRAYWSDNYSFNWSTVDQDRRLSFSSDLYESVKPDYVYPYLIFMKMVINHEFFHGIQYSHNPTFFLTNNSLEYDFLVEGQARFIETIINAEELSGIRGMYKLTAENYIAGCSGYSLNTIKYDYALFWRYLFEHYNNTGSPNLTSQLSIVREMMSGYFNTDLQSIETFMDSKLNSGSMNSMDDVIRLFAKAVCFNDAQYGLWTDGGDNLYIEPNSAKLEYDGTDASCTRNIPASFGLDYVEITMNEAGSVLVTVNANKLNIASPMTLYGNLLEVTPTGLGDDRIIDLSNGANSIVIENGQQGQKFMLILARIDSREEEFWGTGGTFYDVKLSPLYDPAKLHALFKVSGGEGSTVQFVNLPIELEDLSIPGSSPIQTWEWSFPGGNPSASTLQNPTVEYAAPGYYGVGLTVHNQSEASTLFISDYINVLDPGLNTGGSNSPWITFYHDQLNSNLISLHINILGGIPRFHVAYQKNGSTTLIADWTYETSFTVLVPSTPGNNELVVYVDSDDPNGGGNATYQYYIGNPGAHTVAFDYTYAGLNPSQPILGVYTPVTFTDMTYGGFKPYMQWEWVWGNELGSGAAPIPSSGPPWEIIGNSYFNPDPDLSGNPSKTIQFPVIGIYPVTLNVIDFAGFCNSTTKNIEVGAACQCLTLQETIKDGGANFNVHSNKVRMNGSPTVFLHNFTPGEYFNCYYTEHWCQAQTSDAPQYDDRSITDFRWKLYRNGYEIGEETHNMPSDWANTHQGAWDTWVGTQTISQQSFSYTFTTKGRYELYFDAKNRREHTQDMSTMTFENQTNYHMYDAVLNVIQAIDCNEVIEINQDIANAGSEVNYSGEYIFASINPVNFLATAQQAYEACTAISMRPGFTIASGSTFTGTIDPIINISGKSSDEVISLDAENAPVESHFTVYPNPNRGVFTIRCNTESFAENKDIEITNAVGQHVQFIVTEANNEKRISIIHPVPGFCIIRFKDADGQTHCHKAVII